MCDVTLNLMTNSVLFGQPRFQTYRVLYFEKVPWLFVLTQLPRFWTAQLLPKIWATL
jgi:hypothetical protein